MNDLENSQLTDLYTALVLTRKIDKKFLMTLEYLVLRRIHGMDTLDLVKMVFSYSQLMSQGRVWSTNVIKTLEYMVANKWHDFQSDDQARILSAFYAMAQKKCIKNDTKGNRSYINTILDLTS